MDLLDRLVFLLIGGGVGYILGFMTRPLFTIEKEVRTINASKRNRDQDGFMRHPLVADALAVAVVILVAFSSIQAQHALNKVEDTVGKMKEQDIDQDKKRCEAGVDSRDVSRNIVNAIWQLATAVVNRDENAPPLTDEQVIATNAYIDRVNAFRENMYDKIKPPEICKDFVTDNNVKPPSSPFPHVTN
jgi:hypothetical protein